MIEEKDEIDLFLDSQVKTEKELLQEKCEKNLLCSIQPGPKGHNANHMFSWEK